MFRSILVGMLTLATLIPAATAHAEWFEDFMHSVVRDTKRRNCWPRPFVAADRQSVRAPFGTMVSNGWRSENMIGDHHFIENTGRLTAAGKMRIEWILYQAPEQHRIIYVFRGRTADETALRVETVQQLAMDMVPDGIPPQVIESNIPALGTPAARLDAVDQAFRSTSPDPRMPAFTE